MDNELERKLREGVITEITDSDVAQIFENVENYIRKDYLSQLQDAKIVPLPAALSELQAGENLRLFKLSSISYSTTDDIYEKISTVFSALSGFDTKQILILDSDGNNTDLYLGIASNSINSLRMEFDTLKSSFIGNFPGGNVRILNNPESENLIHSIFDEENVNISSVSALTTADGNSKNSIYGIERLVDGMREKPFTMVLISDTVARSELADIRRNLENVYTQLSAYRNISFSVNNTEGDSYSESLSVAESESESDSKSFSKGSSFSESRGKSMTKIDEEQIKRNARNQLLGTFASLGLTFLSIGTGNEQGAAAFGKDALQGMFYGNGIGGIISSAETMLGLSKPKPPETENEGESHSVNFSESTSKTSQIGYSVTKGITDGNSRSSGKTIQMNYENKSVVNLLEVLETQIKRIQHIEENGGFSCAAYFITGDNAVARTVTNMYKSLLGRGNNLCQNSAINIWSAGSTVNDLKAYLMRLNHPMFYFDSKPGFPQVSASSLVSSDEIPMYVSLPQKSLCGLPVSSRAEFARDVVSAHMDEKEKTEIGLIYHMGKKEMNKVCLSDKNLRGHMFVAGSTGMGKSNFCYGIISKLLEKNIKVMVIEPAKGEYNQVFGGMDGVYCFGTNPNLMPLLKINPFSFPEGVHVTEHIDRLLEIFNSCWPMYAAMPAVLKEAVETIYKNCGYNMITGRSKNKGVFPNFEELLDILPKVIEKSKFSGEVKGNYIGSLVTRVQSLTDGIYGSIFSSNEIDNSVLFDENVLIDLSRVGSSETKALIMGLLIMKLQEYRMTTSKMNMPLKHITLLEEAHHLLKGSTGSSAEGVNLRAMSLEMITNSIAEMRTYGEGFLIADQSPSLMDSAVIRNTNTKVIFKLQESVDRQVIGNALSLTEAQVNELSKLECGVAVVFQSGWDNPVLSKINQYDESKFVPYVQQAIDLPDIDEDVIKTQFLAALLSGSIEDAGSSFDYELVKFYVENEEFVSNESRKLLKAALTLADSSEKIPFGDICRYLVRFINVDDLFEVCASRENVSEWVSRARSYINGKYNLNEVETNTAIRLCVQIYNHKCKKTGKYGLDNFVISVLSDTKVERK